MKKALCLSVLMSLMSGVLIGNNKKVQTPRYNYKVQMHTDSIRLKITIGQKVVSAILLDNPTSHDFVDLLPLTLSLKDFNGTEKIADLPKKLSTKGAADGYKPSASDITYYAPWGNLALFYKNFRYSEGLILLGEITGDVKFLNSPETLYIKVELDK